MGPEAHAPGPSRTRSVRDTLSQSVVFERPPSPHRAYTANSALPLLTDGPTRGASQPGSPSRSGGETILILFLKKDFPYLEIIFSSSNYCDFLKDVCEIYHGTRNFPKLYFNLSIPPGVRFTPPGVRFTPVGVKI